MPPVFSRATQMHGLNASGRSPVAWTPEPFDDKGIPLRGWNSVTVPDAVSASVELHRTFGKLPFPRLFEHAIDYGHNGFLGVRHPRTRHVWILVGRAVQTAGFPDRQWPGSRQKDDD